MLSLMKVLLSGINDTAEAKAWIQGAIDSDSAYIALDSETTALYPRNGHILGISMSYNWGRVEPTLILSALTKKSKICYVNCFSVGK